MNNQRKWEILSKLGRPALPAGRQKSKVKTEEIIDALLKNRGIKSSKERKEFFNPRHPKDLTLRELGISKSQVVKAIQRIREAIKKEQIIIIYGDYDVDGICGTGILFETLYLLHKNVRPHLPDRFSEGYGLNPDSVVKLKDNHSKLGVIICVDNGISAFTGVAKAKELGIDVIIVDHHYRKKGTLKSFATVYTKKITGAEIAWIFAREVRKKLNIKDSQLTKGNGLELAALGTIADMLPLLGPNRSFAWHGMKALRQTSRLGLLALFEEARIVKEKIVSYEVNYIISPRLNAAGRLENATDSLRLICTGSRERANELSQHLGRVNTRRQGIQEDIVLHAKNLVAASSAGKVLVLADESYHEGVVGLAAAKLVEEFGRPAIVFAKGAEISKGSGRSVSGFDLVSALSKVGKHLISWGGHKAAAGLTISTKKIEVFAKEFAKVADPLLTDEILERKLKIDLELEFAGLTREFLNIIKQFEPTGAGNPAPDFATNGVTVLTARAVGVDGKHLKLKLEKGGFSFDAIAFSRGDLYPFLSPDKKIDIAYSLAENTWNGQTKIQLKIRDIKIPSK